MPSSPSHAKLIPLSSLAFSSVRPKPSTISLLASPIVLNQSGPSEPNSLFISSSHLADHKRGWFSQLFQKKQAHAESTAFSVLSLHETGQLIVSTFVAMGVRAWTDGDNVVRVKVDEEGRIPGVKPARFRLEMAVVNGPPSQESGGSISAPAQWDSPKPGSLTPRMMSSSASKGAQGQVVPVECAVVVVCLHEKGSATGARTMFRRLKAECEAGGDFVVSSEEAMV